MNWSSLKTESDILTHNNEIVNWIKSNEKWHWLLDAQVDNAVIEIKNNTLIWKDGIWYSGDFLYGIWENGTFWGRWINGLWINGKFNGEWLTGLKSQNRRNETQKNIERQKSLIRERRPKNNAKKRIVNGDNSV